MPRRATPDLPPDRRQVIIAELQVHAQIEARAALDKYVRVSFAYDAGMTTREIAAAMEISPDTAGRWKDWGEQERARRRGEDPGGPGELGQVG